MFISGLPQRRTIAGVNIEMLVKGEGRPLLFLHAGHGVDANDPLVEKLAQSHKVYAVSHPGFGGSDLPKYLSTVDDLAHFYLDVLEELDLRDVTVVGVSFGAWLALEIATKGTDRLAKLVLIDALGLKFSDRETRDITDIFAWSIEQLPELFFSDKQKGLEILSQLDFKSMDESAVTRFVRNREALVLFGWSPTLYNPRLRHRLHRVKQPVLLVWGADDRVVSVDYGRKVAAALPNARLEVVEGAGHYGYLEKPAAFAHHIDSFFLKQ
jgi:pimeloyl-ACP methyl ester carboxylesterase